MAALQGQGARASVPGWHAAPQAGPSAFRSAMTLCKDSTTGTAGQQNQRLGPASHGLQGWFGPSAVLAWKLRQEGAVPSPGLLSKLEKPRESWPVPPS